MQNNELVAFDALKAEIQAVCEPILSIEVKSEESCQKAILTAKEVKFWAKKVEDKRKELVEPHNQFVKRVNTYAKGILSPLDGAESHIKAQLRDWELKLERERQAALKKAEEERRAAHRAHQEELKRKQEEAEMASLFKSEDDVKRESITLQAEQERVEFELQEQHRNSVKSIEANKVSGSRRVWAFEVTDEAQIPREFLMVNEKAIRAAVNAGTREIAGCRIYQDVLVAVR